MILAIANEGFFCMGKFDGILICTDLDGTLLRNDKTISQENLAAIEYFKREGGYFTFITGRMPYYAMHICDAIKPNAPIGAVNGGGIYDQVEGKYIWTKELPKSVFPLVQHIEESFPGVGIHANAFKKTYFTRYNSVIQSFRARTNLPDLVCHYTQVTEPIAKMIFGIETEEEMQAVQQAVMSYPLEEEFDFIRSEKTLLEILPKGVNKGLAIEKLEEHLKVDKTIAIGDYNNDIAMFYAAKVGIAVANACPEALAAADRVTVSNEEHAIAKVIADLESGAIRF